MVADAVSTLQAAAALIGAIAGIATLITALVVAATTNKTHKLVNSNHQQDIARIDQLTSTIVEATGVDLPARPGTAPTGAPIPPV